VLGQQSPASPPGWLAVLAGTAAAGAVSALLICAAMAATQPGFSTGSAARVVVSVGVVDDAGQDGDVIDLLEMAAAATRLARSRGSDRCEVYTADLGVRTGRRRLGRVPRDLASLAVQRGESAATG
jgi:hypothetical protein